MNACFSALAAAAAAALVLATSVFADQNLVGNVTITGGASGNLTVTGWIDSDSNSLTFGTQSGGSYGAALLFADNVTDTMSFGLNRSSGSWLWMTTNPSALAAMRLTSAHQLLLYQADGSTAGVTLTPSNSSLGLGTAMLTATGTTIAANGAFSAASFGGTSGSVSLTGLVGIGTSTPGTNLEVAGNLAASASNGFVELWGDSSIIWKAGGAVGGLRFGSATNMGAGGYSEKMRISDAGNVGIGATSPGAPLDLGTHVQNNVMYIYNDGSNRYGFGIQGGQLLEYAANGANLTFGQMSSAGVFTERARIDSSGKLGVGTSSPGVKLDVGANTGDTIRSYGGFVGNATANIGGTGAAAYFPNGLWANGSTEWIYGYIYINGPIGDTSSRLLLNPGGFSYLNGGNVGVGTQSPNYLLDVSGVVHSKVTSGNNIVIGKSTGASLAFDNDGGVQTALIESGSPTTSNHLEFWTNTSSNSGIVERMRIDNAGNVGIGTTTPQSKLTVAGQVSVTAGPLLVTPAGDLSMGSFTSGSTPQ